MEYIKGFISVGDINKQKWIKQVESFPKNWYCPSYTIRLHRVTSRNVVYIFTSS